jgi:hypothetical protein
MKTLITCYVAQKVRVVLKLTTSRMKDDNTFLANLEDCFEVSAIQSSSS